MGFLSRGADGSLRCAIKAIPGSSRSAVSGVRGDELVVKVAAAPEKGKANAELIAFLAKSLDCPKSRIRLLAGDRSPHKLLEVPETALAFFLELGAEAPSEG